MICLIVCSVILILFYALTAVYFWGKYAKIEWCVQYTHMCLVWLRIRIFMTKCACLIFQLLNVPSQVEYACAVPLSSQPTYLLIHLCVLEHMLHFSPRTIIDRLVACLIHTQQQLTTLQ